MRISDWSSDVCSSDLYNLRSVAGLSVEKQLQRLQMLVEVERTNHRNDFPGRQSGHQSTSAARCSRGRIEEHTMLLGRSTVLKHMACRTDASERSEERRVGKECVSTCRSRCSRDHSKKK